MTCEGRHPPAHPKLGGFLALRALRSLFVRRTAVAPPLASTRVFGKMFVSESAFTRTTWPELMWTFRKAPDSTFSIYAGLRDSGCEKYFGRAVWNWKKVRHGVVGDTRARDTNVSTDLVAPEVHRRARAPGRPTVHDEPDLLRLSVRPLKIRMRF